MTIKNIARINAILFFFFWLIVMYAGADHPPPPGFIFIILLILACALLVYFRVPAYINWHITRKEHRYFYVLRDGLLAGFAAGLVTVLAFAGRVILGADVDGMPSAADLLIWFAVVGGMGIVNALVIYLANGFFVNRRKLR